MLRGFESHTVLDGAVGKLVKPPDPQSGDCEFKSRPRFRWLHSLLVEPQVFALEEAGFDSPWSH